MKKILRLDLCKHRVWKDKNIKPEAKEIFSYLYVNGFDRIISHFNIGDIQQTIKIKNKGLRKNLESLKKYNYINYIEYFNGMYEYHIC